MTIIDLDTAGTASERAGRVDLFDAVPASRRLALTAGVLYLTIFVAGLFAELGVRARIVVRDDPAATAANVLESPMLFRLGVAADVVMLLCDVAIAVVLYRLLAPVSRTMSMVAAAFRLTQAAVLGLNLLSMFQAIRILDDADYLGSFGAERIEALALLSLDSHRYGYILGLTFFGVATMIIARIGWVSGRMPRGLAIVLALAGAGYVVDTATFLMIPGYDGAASAVVLAPAVVAELWFAVWLLTRGHVLADPADDAWGPRSPVPRRPDTGPIPPLHQGGTS